MAAKSAASAVFSSACQPPEVLPNEDGSVSFKYNARESGLHELAVLHNDRPIPGGPFKTLVDSVGGTGRVSAFGAGLTAARSGQTTEFTVLLHNADKKDIQVELEGPSSADVKITEKGAGQLNVQYMPLSPGDYQLHLKYKNREMSGSPLTVKVVGDALRRTGITLAARSETKLHATNVGDVSDLSATLKSPSGRETPVSLKLNAQKELYASINPREAGDYQVSVLRGGKHIEGSPFAVVVEKDQVGNANSVVISGSGIESRFAPPATKQQNKLTIDTRRAGLGVLHVSLEGPSRPELETSETEPGLFELDYRVDEPGLYTLAVRFAEESVPGAPFCLRVSGEASNRKGSSAELKCEAAPDVGPNARGTVTFSFPNYSLMDMCASLTDPSGRHCLVDMLDAGSQHYQAVFVAKETGPHAVSFRYRGMHIPGSPFPFTIGPLAAVADRGAHRVRAFGDGLERGITTRPSHFNVYYREAGVGTLEVFIEGPSEADIKFEPRQDGSVGVSYTVTFGGEYTVTLKWNGVEVPDSPFVAYIGSEHQDARKLTVSSLTDKGLAPGKPVSFTVRYNGAKGALHAKVFAPSNDEEEAGIQEVDEGDQYVVRFIPRENGPHLVHVMLETEHIPGSPFLFLVGKYDADPSMVHAQGDGLSKGEAGKKAKFVVNTVGAGTGILNVFVDGPSRAEISCEDTDDGYAVSWVPHAGGEYIVAVKFGGNFHIVNSPWRVQVAGAPPAGGSGVREHSHAAFETTQKNGSKGGALGPKDSRPENVHCKGMGLKRAFIGKAATFTVETQTAGTNSLSIGLLGPELMNEEITVRRATRFQYAVSYVVREKGTYHLIVKWGDDLVPDSPFVVEVS